MDDNNSRAIAAPMMTTMKKMTRTTMKTTMRLWSHPGGSTTTKSPPRLSPPHTKPQYEGFKNNTSAGKNSASKVML